MPTNDATLGRTSDPPETEDDVRAANIALDFSAGRHDAGFLEYLWNDLSEEELHGLFADAFAEAFDAPSDALGTMYRSLRRANLTERGQVGDFFLALIAKTPAGQRYAKEFVKTLIARGEAQP